MKKFIFSLTIIIFSLCAHAISSGTFSVVHKQNREEINYNIPSTSDFQISFLNALKTGNTVKVVHTVKIRDVNQWLTWLAEKKYVKYYKYDLINDQYYVGVRETNMQQAVSLKELFEDVTSLKNAPFLPLNVLKKDQAYVLDFTIAINPAEDSFGMLLFKGDKLKERLHGAVHYIHK